jgi:hypothetical protein
MWVLFHWNGEILATPSSPPYLWILWNFGSEVKTMVMGEKQNGSNLWRLCCNIVHLLTDEFSCFCTIDNPEKGLGVSGLSFALLPNVATLIFASCKKFENVSLHTCSLNALSDDSVPRFKESATLYGHTNWINDLAFTTFGECSQD